MTVKENSTLQVSELRFFRFLRRLSVVLVSIMLACSAQRASAFCNDGTFFGIDYTCDGGGHQSVTDYINFLSPGIYTVIQNQLVKQDRDDAKDRDEIHFDSCMFRESAEYINNQYEKVIAALNPAAPDVITAAVRFGELLHPVQDFYAHTNYYDLHGSIGAEHLVDRSVGDFRSFIPESDGLPFALLHDDIVVGQIPPDGWPFGWTPSLDASSAVPVLHAPNGVKYRALVTGWNEDGACPDVRAGEVTDEFSIGLPGPLISPPQPRTTRLVHGDAFDVNRPCKPSYPTSVCLNQDELGRPHFADAFVLAGWQTQHEWCRLLHKTKNSVFGLDAASILMSLWRRPELPPHPDVSPCGDGNEGNEVSGPVEVQVTITALSGRDSPRDHSSHVVFAMYTDDFKSSAYAARHEVEFDDGQSLATADLPEPLTMCVREGATVAATVWGWETIPFPPFFHSNYIDLGEEVRRGTTLTLFGPNFAPGSYTRESADMRVSFNVAVNTTDADGDGLSTCGETYYGTNAELSDTDGDGRNDGDEVKLGSDPRVADDLFEYAAKLVCGVQNDPKDRRVAKGFYATAINVHNPNPTDIKLVKELVLAFPPGGQRAGATMRLGVDSLAPGQALLTDCVDIQQRLFPDGFPAPGYIDGFVVIQSKDSLDVSAVYTTASVDLNGLAADQSGIHVERISERKVWPKKLPDLLPIRGNLASPYCTIKDRKLAVTIRNQGPGPASVSRTEVDFLRFGKSTQATVSLLPAAETELLFNLPADCFDSGGTCKFRITADATPASVFESNEANNVAEGSCFLIE